jgi:hypothetical protein
VAERKRSRCPAAAGVVAGGFSAPPVPRALPAGGRMQKLRPPMFPQCPLQLSCVSGSAIMSAITNSLAPLACRTIPERGNVLLSDGWPDAARLEPPVS